MRYVRERSTMHERRIVLQRLHQIGLHRVPQQHRHRAVGLDIAAMHGRPVAPVRDDHVTQPSAQVVQIARQAEDRHDFRCDGYVKPRLPRKTVGGATKRAGDAAQGPVIHVDDTAPCHPARVDLQFVPPVDMVIYHGAQKGMRTGDRMEIAGEMEVHILHRHYLRVSAASRPALHPEVRPQGSFSDADHRVPADRVEAVAETDRSGCLALTGRSRVDRGDKDKPAVSPSCLGVYEFERNLRFVMAEGYQVLARDAEFRSDLLDRHFPGRTRNLDIRHVPT